MTTVEEVKEQSEALVQEARPWVVRLARLGFVAKGIVFATTGLLALQASFGVRSAEVDQEEALLKIGSEPPGKILLLIIVLGLAGYVLWQFVRALVDSENTGAHAGGLLKRGLFLLEGIVYASLAWTALNILAGQVGSSEQGTKLLVASLITFPAGRWLTGTAGIALAAISLIILVQTFRADFVEDCKLWEMSAEEHRWITHFGRAGNVGRSLVFAVTGIFLFQAAWTYNSQQAGDLGDSLKALAAQPYGPWVLAAVGVGLIAYGAYALGMAAYRRIAVRKNDYPDSPER